MSTSASRRRASSSEAFALEVRALVIEAVIVMMAKVMMWELSLTAKEYRGMVKKKLYVKVETKAAAIPQR